MHFVLGECGVGWLPLSRMDEEYDDQFRHLSLTMKPSEYWRRQGIPPSSMNPTWPPWCTWWVKTSHVGRRLSPPGRRMARLGQGDRGRFRQPERQHRRKITCDNAGKLYGLL